MLGYTLHPNAVVEYEATTNVCGTNVLSSPSDARFVAELSSSLTQSAKSLHSC